MQVRTLIELLNHFNPDADVQLSLDMPGRVIAASKNVGVTDYGGGPQLHAALDPRHFCLCFGCGMEQTLTDMPTPPLASPGQHSGQTPADVDLGEYSDEELAVKVRDFFNYHRRPEVPLRYPDFDYANWIAPRTISGGYNEHIAAILSEKFLKD
jgi:hypothetical protein